MNTNNLFNLCNIFYKLATDKKGQLESMLQSALSNMDNNTFQVFLDLLEEERPHQKNKLMTSKNLSSRLKLLMEYFPSVLKMNGHPALNQIGSPYFPFKSISPGLFGEFHIEYGPNSERRIIGNENDDNVTIIISFFDPIVLNNNQNIHTIRRWQGIVSCSDENDRDLPMTEEIIGICENNINEWLPKAKKDYENLKNALKIS